MEAAMSSSALGGKGMDMGAAKLTYSQRLGGLVQVHLVFFASLCPTVVTAPLCQMSWHETASAKHYSSLI